MLSAALIAMMIAAPPDLSVPLSPVGLTPPPIPAPSPVGTGLFFSTRSDWVGALPDVCRHKALAAVAEEAGFRFAEINADGQIEGYTNTCRFVVLVAHGVDRSYVFVAVSSRVNDSVFPPPSQSVDRVSSSILDRIAYATADPKMVKRVGTADPDLEKKLLPISWYVNSYPSDDLVRHFVPVAKLAFEKRGFEVGQSTENCLIVRKHVVMPTAICLFRMREYSPFNNNEKAMVLVRQPMKKTLAKNSGELAVVDVSPHMKGETTKVFFATTGNAIEHDKAAEELKAICAVIGKIVFE